MAKGKSNKPRTDDIIRAATAPTPQQQAPNLTVRHQMAFSGPLPAPHILREYDETLPGLAERVVQIALAEAEHRRALEVKIVDSEIAEQGRTHERNTRAQHYALITTIAGFATAGACAALHAFTAAGVIGGGTIAAVASVFLTGRLLSGRQPAPETENAEQKPGELTKKS